MSNKKAKTSLREFRGSAWESLNGYRGRSLGLTFLSLLFGGTACGSIFRAFILILSLPYTLTCLVFRLIGQYDALIGSIEKVVTFFKGYIQTVLEGLQLPTLLGELTTDFRLFCNSIGISLSDSLFFSIKELMEILFVFTASCSVLFLFWAIFGEAVYVGRCRWHLDRADGIESQKATLFSAFGSHFGKAFLLRITRFLFVALWSILFVIPGIIAAYRYSMAAFVLAEHPEMRVRDALHASAAMMKGNKWRYFALRFSFIGWHLLAVLSLGVEYFWLLPYIHQAKTMFYNEVSGRVTVRESINEAGEQTASFFAAQPVTEG